MSHEHPDVELFYSLETSLHRPEIRTEPNKVADLLGDEFLEFGKSGRVYDKRITVDALAGESSSGPLLKVTDFSVRALSNSVVLVTYKSIGAVPDAVESNETLRSSIWKFDLGRWQMVFHQGTPVPPGNR